MQEPAGPLSVGESAPAATAPTEAVGAVRPEPASELASDPPSSDPAPEPEGASADAPTDGEAQAVELSEAQAMEVIAAVEAVRAGGATAETELHGWHIGFSVRAVAKGKAEASPQLRSDRSLLPAASSSLLPLRPSPARPSPPKAAARGAPRGDLVVVDPRDGSKLHSVVSLKRRLSLLPPAEAPPSPEPEPEPEEEEELGLGGRPRRRAAQNVHRAEPAALCAGHGVDSLPALRVGQLCRGCPHCSQAERHRRCEAGGGGAGGAGWQRRRRRGVPRRGLGCRGDRGRVQRFSRQGAAAQAGEDRRRRQAGRGGGGAGACGGDARRAVEPAAAGPRAPLAGFAGERLPGAPLDDRRRARAAAAADAASR